MTDNNSQRIKQDLSPGLLRQRRNLIIISLIMPLFVFGGAFIEQVNVFGTVIYIKSQYGVGIIIFVIYLYFLFRYWQYYGVEGRAREFRTIRDAELYDIEFSFFSDLMRSKAECFELKHYYPCFKEPDRSHFVANKVLPDKKLDKKISLFRSSREMEIYGLDDKYTEHYLKSGDGKVLLSEKEVGDIERHWKLVDKLSSDSRSGAVFEAMIAYNIVYLGCLRLLTRVKFIISHPYFSDYQLPFYIAGCSLFLTIVYLIL